MNNALAKMVYHGVQRLRSGVTDEMIRHATDLLNGEIDWRIHVAGRLGMQYGVRSEPLMWLAQQTLTDRRTIIATGLPVVPRHVTVEKRKTSGSSGVPFQFYRDRRMTAQMDAVMWAAYSWHGVFPGDRQARFWGMPVGLMASSERRITDRLQNRRRLSAFDVTKRRCLAYFQQLRGFRPNYMYGYPTLIHEFVQYCRAARCDGEELGVHVVICTGELLHPAVREEIGSFLNARVVNEYGCTESGVLSLTCEAGGEHILPFATYPELVTAEGAPVARGETGQVIVTDLYGEVMPMFRYKLNDLAAYSLKDVCQCGRSLPLLEIQRGRIDGFVLTPDGRRIYDALLAYTVPKGVLRFTVKQVSIDHLHALVMPGAGFDPDSTPKLCARVWEDAFGPEMKVTVEVVEDIALASSGKLRYFIPLDGT